MQPTTYHLQPKHGFTLLELLLSIAVIGVLSGLSFPVYRTLMMKNDLDIAAATIASSLRRTQILSQAVDGDATWGVNIQSGGITLFKGASFTGRYIDFDEVFDVPTTITTSGVTEIVFDKFTGLPQTTGTITLSSESDDRSVTINGKGMVSY